MSMHKLKLVAGDAVRFSDAVVRRSQHHESCIGMRGTVIAVHDNFALVDCHGTFDSLPEDGEIRRERLIPIANLRKTEPHELKEVK